jgi:hypothetical protein
MEGYRCDFINPFPFFIFKSVLGFIGFGGKCAIFRFSLQPIDHVSGESAVAGGLSGY